MDGDVWGRRRAEAVALQREERPCFRLFQLEETMAADTPAPGFESPWVMFLEASVASDRNVEL